MKIIKKRLQINKFQFIENYSDSDLKTEVYYEMRRIKVINTFIKEKKVQ